VSDETEETEEQQTPSEENGEATEITPFDFKRSNRIPKEQHRTITLIHESYAQTIALSLAAFLRSEVTVSLKEVEQVPFHEYILSLTNPTCVCTFDMQPLSGTGVMEVNSILIYTIIDKMLGGDGTPPSVARAFTDIELAITRKLLNLLLTGLSDSWGHILRISFGLQDIQTNPAFIREIPSRETCVTILFKVTIGESTGMMTLCVPYVTLEPIAGKLRNEQFNRFGSKQTDDVKTAHQRNFMEMDLDVSATLGCANLTMAELLLLQPGDIVATDQKARNPIQISVAGTPKFTATPGLIGRHRGVGIQNEINKD
jgi:flagellar motor switch protein FliM